MNEALHLSEQEREIVTDCIHKIQIELEHAIDKHSKQLIVRNIDYCSTIACASTTAIHHP